MSLSEIRGARKAAPYQQFSATTPYNDNREIANRAENHSTVTQRKLNYSYAWRLSLYCRLKWKTLLSMLK